MGAGKTICTIYFALRYGFKLLIVGPANIESNWKDECEKYKASYEFVSYPKLARGHTAYINTSPTGGSVPSAHLINLIKGKCLVVYDEAQDVKNPKCKSFKACNLISKTLIELNCGSRIFILSATLLDQEKFAESALKLSGIISTDELFHYDLPTKKYVTAGYGYEQALSFCYKYDAMSTNMSIPSKFNAKQCRLSLFKLLTNVVNPFFSHAMTKPVIDARFIPRLGYFKMEEPYDKLLSDAINRLQKAVKYNPEDNSVAQPNGAMKEVLESHQDMERSKLTLFVRLIYEQLVRDPHCKVIVYVWYHASVEYLMKVFVHFNPIQANGQVHTDIRHENIKLFMEPTDTHRLIIGHPKAAGIGLSLDDQHGGRERHTFASPNYHFTPIHQCSGRTYRTNTKSDAHFTLVYGKDQIEHSIMDALYRKTEVTKAINPEEGNIYPGDYPVYQE